MTAITRRLVWLTVLAVLMSIVGCGGDRAARPDTSESGGPTATPPTPAEPYPGIAAPDRFAQVDAALAELITGSIAFNTPERMQLGESLTLAAVASSRLDADALTQEVRRRVGNDTAIAIQQIQIAPVMEAMLNGAPAFEVTVLTPARQPVSRSAPTEWRWSVQAREAGTHALHLTVNAVVTVGGDQFARSLKVVDRDIAVDITAGRRAAMFVEANWQWLVGTIVLPFGLWLWTNRRKQKGRRRV